MNKYFSVVAGIAVIALGFFGIVNWRQEIAVCIKGFLPLFLILTGVIAVIAGIGNIQDEKLQKK